MIAVVGSLASVGPPVSIAAIAAAAVRAGAATQLVTTVADDVGGDARLATLAAQGIGHAAVLRTPAPTLEPADLELALRYLTDLAVIVMVAPGPALLAPAGSAAEWSDAHLVVVVAHGDAVPESLESPAGDGRATVIEAPARDPDGTFAGFVGLLAARLAAGDEPAAAWRQAVGETNVDRVSPRAAR